MKFRHFFVAALALCLGGMSCSPKPPAGRPLVVGMELAYPPFEMTDASGNPAGVSVDMARALAAHLNRELVIQNIPFTGLISSLKTGKIDLIISSLTMNEERAKSIDFSEPYLRTGLCLLVGKDTGIASIEDADKEGRVIVVNQGTTGHTYAVDRLKAAKIKVLDKEQNCVLEVLQGRADAFVYDQMSIYTNWRKNPDHTIALLRPFQEEAWAIGIRKGNDTLRTEVNQFLSDFRAKGGFDKLAQTHLAPQKAAFEELGIPFMF